MALGEVCLTRACKEARGRRCSKSRISLSSPLVEQGLYAIEYEDVDGNTYSDGTYWVNATIPANSTGSYTVPYTLPSVIDKGSLFITGAYGPYVWSGWA